MAGVHDSIWRSCEAATEKLRAKQRIPDAEYYEPSPPDLENGPCEDDVTEGISKREQLIHDAVEVAVTLGILRSYARKAAERLDAPTATVEDLAAFICRHAKR